MFSGLSHNWLRQTAHPAAISPTAMANCFALPWQIPRPQIRPSKCSQEGSPSSCMLIPIYTSTHQCLTTMLLLVYHQALKWISEMNKLRILTKMLKTWGVVCRPTKSNCDTELRPDTFVLCTEMATTSLEEQATPGQRLNKHTRKVQELKNALGIWSSKVRQHIVSQKCLRHPLLICTPSGKTFGGSLWWSNEQLFFY